MKKQHLNSEKKLAEIIGQVPLIIGIGNTLRGDDAAGTALLDLLDALGYPHLFDCGANPENYLYKIAGYPAKCRLWVDAIQFRGKPGEWKIFNRDEVAVYDISTHNFSPDLLSRFLENIKPATDFFLGIQPLQMQLGAPLSPDVKQTIDWLSRTIIQIYRSSGYQLKKGNQPQPK
ncbi:MAG: hypothetical protein Kow0037_02750 [Calditrichia bacterium]